MPTYEYRCLTCSTVFEQRRSMADSDAPASCPSGHADTKRLLSVFAATSGGGGDSLRAAPTSAAPSRPGGCCGGACH